MEKTFYDMGNVHVCNNGISSIHGKELPEQLSFHPEYKKISHWNKCSTYLQDWCLNKMRSLDWKQLVGKIIHGNTCLWLAMKELSIFSAQRSTSFQILYCVLVIFSKTSNRTMHGNKGWDGSKLLRITGTLTDRRRASGLRVEYFLRVQYVAAQWRSQKFTVEIRRDTREFHRKDYLQVNVQRIFFVDQETMKKNASRMINSFLKMQKDLE